MCASCHKKFDFTPARRETLSNVHKGKPLSSEHKNQIRLSLTGKKRKPLTPELKARLSLAHLGKKLPIEQKEKISIALKKYHSEELT
jgi:hypothetical protein